MIARDIPPDPLREVKAIGFWVMVGCWIWGGLIGAVQMIVGWLA